MGSYEDGMKHFYRGGANETWQYPDTVGILRVDVDYPWMQKFQFDYETNYYAVPASTGIRRYYWIAPITVLLYLFLIHWGQRAMRNRKAFDLRTPLKYWNFFLTIFSLWASVRVVPAVFYIILEYGFGTFMCSPPSWAYGRGPLALWSTLYVYSKYFELIDTAFIILRKKHLSFLHWYHHATVLLYTWDSFSYEQPVGTMFICMNVVVHTIMYYYYYLAAARKRPPSWGSIVTTAQIAQMFGGIILTIFGCYYSFKYPFMIYATEAMARDPLGHGQCYVTRFNLYAAALMYATYLYLFVEFFVKRYLLKAPLAAKAAATVPPPDRKLIKQH